MTLPCPAENLALVVVDWWDYHWCKTYWLHLTQLRPRLNHATARLRRQGASILWAPTDVCWHYRDWPQRRAARLFAQPAVPQVRDFQVAWHVPHQTCHCGPGIPCTFNLTHRSLDPLLDLAPDDLVVDGPRELYGICQARGITDLCYVGAALNACVTHRDLGLAAMWRAGLNCWFDPSLCLAWSTYDPHNGFTPRRGTEIASQDLQNAGVPPLDLLADTPLEHLSSSSPIFITPSGADQRPHFFEQSVVVTIESPRACEIRYELDGQVRHDSPSYPGPLTLDRTAWLWAAGFEGDRRVTLQSAAFFQRIDEEGCS